MLENKKIFLYLKSQNYNPIGPLNCACFSSIINMFNNDGNYRKEITKIFLPLDKTKNKLDFNIQVEANIDMVLISDVLEPLQAQIDIQGNLINGSDLLRKGAQIVTLASKKDYGSPSMHHYYIEVE